MSNILKACLNISHSPVIELTDYYNGRNRINNVGEALEIFIEDAFAGTINEDNEQNRLSTISQIYSYSGNQNNPPDYILVDGDAIEVKKIQSPTAALALNSSYPKAKLFANDSMITEACRNCETWNEKDIIYAVGYTTDNSLKALWMVYGDCYAAEKNIYERIKQTISDGITTLDDVDFTETNELGKVKRVDPLGITDLRIRGMWHIANPKKVFDYIYEFDNSASFQLISIMRNGKYSSFPEDDRNQIEASDLISVNDIQIKDPNNPANLLDAKGIIYKISEAQ